MRCRHCSKEIDEFEIFCDECKKNLRKNSSKDDVKEFEKLVDEHKNIDDLEQTKELNTLKNLVVEEIEKETIDENKIEEEVEIDVDFADIKTNNKKTIIIIISVILGLIILGLVLFFVIFSNNEKEEEIVVKTDYQKILNEYGDEVSSIVKKHIDDNGDIPTWQQVSELITYNYNAYEVVCKNHNIYKDGSIYLDSCKVNNKTIKYSYGSKQEETKDGKKIEIYKSYYDSIDYEYVTTASKDSKLVGEIICQTENCDFEVGYDKYAIIKEEEKYYLYDYENSTLEFGPFIFDDNQYMNNIFSHKNKLYGILFNENGINSIYNVDTSKTLKNIKGVPYVDVNSISDLTIINKYGYVIMKNNNVLDFVNLKTGNVSYTIKEYIGLFVEDTDNNIVYMIVYDSLEDYSKFKLINSNGKLLFDGKYFRYFKLYNKNLIVADDTNYYVYDSKLKLKHSSKNYQNVLAIYDEYVVVVNNNKLQIVNLSDNIMATYEDEWNNNYTLDNGLSGYVAEDKISLIIEDGITGTQFEYYYIPSTKESGKTETNGLN